jgi:hypothetical protein
MFPPRGRIVLASFSLFLGPTAHSGDFIPADRMRDPLKQLVFDTRVIEKTDGVRLTLGQVVKDPRNPLTKPDKPWEDALDNVYPNLIYDEQERLFKLWHKCVLDEPAVAAKQEPPPQLINGVAWYLCYATSRDGLTWEKPLFDLHPFDGSRKTNAVARGVANVGVFKDPHDPDPARRYKMLSDIGARLPDNMRAGFSPDGIHWTAPSPLEGLGNSGDTHTNAFWDERLGKYVMFSRLYQGERLVSRSESADFLHWEKPRVVLRSTPEEGKATQTYCMPVFPYANVYLGFVMMYHESGDRAVDCELAWSPDSIEWHRLAPGNPFIPRGPGESYDAGCIYAQAGSPVVKDDKLWIYYGGIREVHRGWKRDCHLCLARLRLDGFAGYEAGESAPGTVLTAPLASVGEPLRVTADIREGGELRAEIIGVEGCSASDCEPLRANATDAIIRWKTGKSLADFKGKTVRLRFTLRAATRYAFTGLRQLPASP